MRLEGRGREEWWTCGWLEEYVWLLRRADRILVGVDLQGMGQRCRTIPAWRPPRPFPRICRPVNPRLKSLAVTGRPPRPFPRLCRPRPLRRCYRSRQPPAADLARPAGRPPSLKAAASGRLAPAAPVPAHLPPKAATLLPPCRRARAGNRVSTKKGKSGATLC